MSDYVFKLPDLGEGTVESEIGEWFVKVGDVVEEEAVVATMMTDKAAVELSSPVSGKVKSLAGEPGDVVAVGAPLITFFSITNDKTATVLDADMADETATPVEAPASKRAGNGADGKIVTSPAIRRIARESNIDLKHIAGSGSGGRILRTDIDTYLKQSRPSAPLPHVIDERPSREVKIIGLRRIIAERMSTSKREIPHFSYVEEIDITELESLRQHLNSKQANKNDRLTLLPFIAMALVRALKAFPQCNATHDKERNVVVQHGSINLGVATQTPDGLKVPVVQKAESRSIDGLSAEIRRVTDAARNNTAKKHELSGSTITLTSLGKLGGIVTTPVINLPEVAIIGVNRAVERPVVVNGQIAIRTIMNLSSSFDHRFVDGYDAAAMIQHVKDLLEHPATIFIR